MLAPARTKHVVLPRAISVQRLLAREAHCNVAHAFLIVMVSLLFRHSEYLIAAVDCVRNVAAGHRQEALEIKLLQRIDAVANSVAGHF